MTVVETSEYIQTIQIQIDLTGTNVDVAQVSGGIKLKWYGFLTPPVIAAV